MRTKKSAPHGFVLVFMKTLELRQNCSNVVNIVIFLSFFYCITFEGSSTNAQKFITQLERNFVQLESKFA